MKNKKGNVAVVAIVVVIVVITAGVVGWMFANKKQATVIQPVTVQQPVVQSVTPVQQPQEAQVATITKEQVANKIADWQTYTNKRYAYQINFPKGWVIDKTFSEDDFTLRGVAPGQAGGDNMGGDTTWSSKPLPKTPDGSIAGIQSVNFFVYKVDPKTTIDQFVAEKKFETVDNKENINVNGIEGEKIFLTDNIQDLGKKSEMIILKISDKMFVFGPEKLPADTMETMVATFKLGTLVR